MHLPGDATGERARALFGSGPADDGAGRVVPDHGTAYWLSGALAAVAVAGALLTYLAAGVLRGPAVMDGSARGTALAVAAVGVPVLACSVILARRGSVIAVVTWLGAVWFLLYNSLMFVFATPVGTEGGFASDRTA